MLTKESVALGMSLLKYLPVYVVDALVLVHANFIYGDLSKYGIQRPKIGPFTQKAITGRSPVIDVGTIKKIQGGEIRVGRLLLLLLLKTLYILHAFCNFCCYIF